MTVDFLHYRISDEGWVYCLSKKRLLRTFTTGAGYKSVKLRIAKGKYERISLHRLVARHFLPKPSHCDEVHHIDHDKTNNHVSNLRWVTHRENMQISWREGRFPILKGHQASSARFTSSDVHNIRAMISQGMPDCLIAYAYGCARNTICNIRNRIYYAET